MPPCLFTWLAHSLYPSSAAWPGSEKSPENESEMPTTSGAVEPLELDPPEPPPHAAVIARAATANASDTFWDAILTTTPLPSGRRPAPARSRLQLVLQSVA